MTTYRATCTLAKGSKWDHVASHGNPDTESTPHVMVFTDPAELLAHYKAAGLKVNRPATAYAGGDQPAH